MKHHQPSARKARTRMMIQAAGLLNKSGVLDVFLISPGDDLQAYENREKAAVLLGFLTECFETNEFDEDNLKRWRSIGERALQH